MDYAALGVAGIATLVAVTLLARRIGVASPLVLVLVGVGISYLPGVPPVEVPPELILAGVLPPLLYGAAVTVPLVDLRRNLRTIVSLSVVLVLVSAFGIGLLLYALFPNLSFAGALALGAGVSPPDAVAATSIARRLGLPPRLVTVLEGEGLVNDATALVLLRTSIAAVGASVDLWQAAGGFVLSAVGALAIGVVVGIVTPRCGDGSTTPSSTPRSPSPCRSWPSSRRRRSGRPASSRWWPRASGRVIGAPRPCRRSRASTSG